jgi:hypothetical protein
MATLEEAVLRPEVQENTPRYDPAVKAVFDELAAKWHEETIFLSDITKKSTHFAYQQIIGLGPAAVPIILEKLAEGPDHWFWALIAITREDAVKPEHAGKMQLMANDWLEWGHKRGLTP